MDSQVGKSETDRHHAALKRLLALVFVYVGLADDTRSALSATDGAANALSACREPWTLSRRVCRMVLALLRPVEAATRRLIVVLASGSPVSISSAASAQPSATQPMRRDASTQPQSDGETVRPKHGGQAHPAQPPRFALLDPVKRYEWFFSGQPQAASWKGPQPSSPFDELDATAIVRRVAALAQALDDLPAQARRLVRWRSLRMGARPAGKLAGLSPLRPGRPPGSLPRRAPKKDRREEHDLLSEVHALAWRALARFDTS